ncbi:MAG: lamin tail domain-containing protein [Promethearchaeota archaeon]
MTKSQSYKRKKNIGLNSKLIKNLHLNMPLIIFIFCLSFLAVQNNPYNMTINNKQESINNTLSLPINKPFSSVQAVNVCITEVYADGTYEWIEIYNPTTSTIDFTQGNGWVIKDGDNSNIEVDLSATVGSIGPGEVITIGDANANPTPNYTDSIILNDLGDDLIIVDGNGDWVDVLIYGSGTSVNLIGGEWYWITTDTAPAPSNPNESIFRINKTIGGELEDNNMYTDWQFSTSPTPGSLPQYNPKTPTIGDLLISEVKYASIGTEWIELISNSTEDIHIGGCTLYSYNDNNLTTIPINTFLSPGQTYVMGELPSLVDYEVNISLQDAGDVLMLKNGSGTNLDVVVWGSGSNNFQYGSNNGWISSINATGSLSEGESIFRYNITKTLLSDTNSSLDWYATQNPTLGTFYEIKVGDILFSEIGMSEPDGYEFIELYNNLTWPVTLDGVVIYDYGYGHEEIVFSGNITIPARGVIVAGDNETYDYQDEITLTNGYEDLVLYLDSSKTYELDVVIYGDSTSNTYPRGPGSGWNDTANATGGLSAGQSLHRINGTNLELIDTNKSADWKVGAITPGIADQYTPPQPPATPGSVLITELMINPTSTDQGYEYIELYNTLDVPIDVGNWTIRHQSWFATADATLPIGTTIPAKTHLTIIENELNCIQRYNFSGLNYSEDITLANSESDVMLIDSYMNIVDRVAWRSSTTNFTNTMDPNSWTDGGVYYGSYGKSLSRIYDPNNNDEYIDTNSSSDWMYNIYPNPGLHSNNSIFLSTSFSAQALITPFNSPDNSFNAITNLIDKANSTIDICVYQFTNYYILEHIIDAMDRGVKVRLLMEDIYPLYDSPYISDTTHDDENYYVVYVGTIVNNHTNGEVRWESPSYYSYTHAKYMIIDNETVVISTENFKPTGIPTDPSAGNRGWGIAINSSQVAQKYLRVFNFDWNLGTSFLSYELIDPLKNDEILYGDYKPFMNLTTVNVVAEFQTVVGPDETINVIVDLLDNANSCIYMEVFYLYPTWTGYPGGENNNPLLQALIRAADRGVDIKVILDSTDYNIEGDNNNDEAAMILEAHGVEVKFSENLHGIEKFHVKGLIIDNESVLISSLNWNENSATNNREIGIIVTSYEVAEYYVTLFGYDWGGFSSEEIIKYEEEKKGIPQYPLSNSYTWKIWLPILSVVFFGILIAGYMIRRNKEARQFSEMVIKDELPKLYQEFLPVKKNIDLDYETIRREMKEFYGDLVKVCHTNERGRPLDAEIPSDFVQEYIKRNNDLIEVGELLTPLPTVMIFKYSLVDYIVFDGTIDLRARSDELKRLIATYKEPDTHDSGGIIA